MKYALLVGINYTGTPNQLMGCVNDAVNMRQQLIENHGYLAENITMICDGDQATETRPTAHNILMCLQSFAFQKGMTEFFFHYSGHGASIADRSIRPWNGASIADRALDEQDGRDEALVAIDSLIRDDDIKEVFDKIDCPIYCLFDCCHSGTALDLNFQYQFMAHRWENVGGKASKNKVLMISGCLDRQTSADAYINGVFQGAMTHAYIETVKRYQNRPTLLQLVLGMRHTLKKGKYKQLPQLNCSKQLDIKEVWLKP